MSRPNWLLTFIKVTFPRNLKFGRITHLPGLSRWLETKFFEGDHIVTLPRAETVQINQSVDDNEQMVLPTELMDYFIDRMEHHWIMNFCICRRSMPCKDYPIDMGCLFMGEPVLDINPEWGRLVTKEEAKEYVRACEEKGLVHFIGKSKLDTQWLGIGPGDKLLTICNCCPCCCITRGLIYAPPNLSEKLLKAPGVQVTVMDNCVGCGKCVEDAVCFVEAIKMDGDKAVIGSQCRGCGRCVRHCPADAISLTIDRETFMKENIEKISSVVEIPG